MKVQWKIMQLFFPSQPSFQGFFTWFAVLNNFITLIACS